MGDILAVGSLCINALGTSVEELIGGPRGVCRISLVEIALEVRQLTGEPLSTIRIGGLLSMGGLQPERTAGLS